MSAVTREGFGGLPFMSFLNSGFTNFTLNQTTDQWECVFTAAEAVTISRLGFRYGLRTGTPPTFIISLQGVDTSGNPDGTAKGGGSPASATFLPPASTAWDATWQWVNLANSYTCTRGEMLAVVIAYSSGTIDGSNNSSFTTISTLSSVGGMPYAIQNDATVRARSAGLPGFGYGSTTTAYGNPLQGFTTLALNSGTTPDEVALRFKMDSGWGSSFQVTGARLAVNPGAATTYKVLLYDGTTVLQDVTIDSDHNSTTANTVASVTFDEATLATLSFGTVYRLSLQPQTATSVTPHYAEWAAAADLAAWPGGVEFYWSQRTDAGAWSDTTTRRPIFEPILCDLSGGGRGGAGRGLWGRRRGL